MTTELIHDDSPDEAMNVVVDGVVERGDQRGRQLGFPTANVHTVEGVPFDGVYAGTVQIAPERNGPTYVAAVSIGHRPTYYGKDGLRLLEANLLDFHGDIYGRDLRIVLRVRLRPQHKYADTPSLVRQLHLDVAATRAWALANGLEGLLSTRLVGLRRRAGSAPRADAEAAARTRAADRMAAIARVVAQAKPGELTHEWLAARTGIPVGYLTWRFPRIADLRAISSEVGA